MSKEEDDRSRWWESSPKNSPWWKRGLQPEHLRELDEVFALQGKDVADAKLDEWVHDLANAARAYQRGQSDRLPLYIVRIHTQTKTHEQAGLKLRLEAIGAGRWLDISSAPVAQHAWLADLPSESNEAPAVQALACLHILQEDLSPAWSKQIAAAHLSQLLMDFPALMHPRIVYAQDGHGTEALAMASSLMTCGVCPLPGAMPGHDDAAVERFASNPIVRAAFTGKSPLVDYEISGRNPVDEGRLVSATAARQRRDRSSHARTLLRYDSILARQGKKSGCMGGRGKAEWQEFVTRAIVHTWTPAEHRERTQLHDAVRTAPLLDRSGLREKFAPSIQFVFMDLWPFTGEDSVDQGGRLHRYLEAIVACGAARSQDEAIREAVRHLFPVPGETIAFNRWHENATADGAAQFLQLALDAGVSLVDLGYRVEVSASSSAIWMGALDAQRARAAMERVIADSMECSHQMPLATKRQISPL